MRKRDRIAIFAANYYQYAELLFASAKTGVISVCLNYAFVRATLIINFAPEDYLDAIENERVDTIMINYALGGDDNSRCYH